MVLSHPLAFSRRKAFRLPGAMPALGFFPRKDIFGGTKRFEFQSVSAWIRHKHRGLLTGLSFEPYAWLDQEPALGVLKFPGQFFPIAPFENQAKVRHRHIFAVYVMRAAFFRARGNMRDNLVTVQVKIDPLVRFAPSGATQKVTVKASGCLEVMDGESEVKRWHTNHVEALVNIRLQFIVMMQGIQT